MAESDLDPERLARMPGDEVLQVLADKLGRQARARSVYGKPVERDGITVVPVAQVRFGFGLGAGSRTARMRTGGGGAMAMPVGYLEITDGSCRYVRIGDRRRRAIGAAVGAGVGALSLAGARLALRRRLPRRLRRRRRPAPAIRRLLA